MGDELSELLAALQAPAESSGAFTIDLVKARHKLAHFQLQPGFYLLKFVQAAATVGAHEVRIAAGDTLFLTILNADPKAFPLQDVATGLTNPAALTPDTPLAHLCTGLLAGLGCLPRELHWSAWRGKEGEALKIDPEGLSTRALRKSPGRWQPSQVRFDLVMVDCQGRDRIGERQAVTGRCGYGPTRVRFNGSLVEPQWKMVEPFGEKPSRLAEFYGSGAGVGLQLSPTRAKIMLPSGKTDLSWSSPLLLQLSDGPGPCDRALCLFDDGDASGKVVWIRHEVGCNATEADLGFPGTYAVVEASDLAVDASHFKLARTPELERRLRELRADNRRLCKALLDNLDRLYPNQIAQDASGCAAVGGCLGGLIGCLFGAPWLGLLTAIAGGVAGNKAVAPREAEWRADLRSRLQLALREP